MYNKICSQFIPNLAQTVCQRPGTALPEHSEPQTGAGDRCGQGSRFDSMSYVLNSVRGGRGGWKGG